MSSSSDPVAALGDAWRRAREVFSSSVRGREVTGTHHLHIGGYSIVDSMFSNGKGIDSRPFRAGGHRWQLSYYPNGVDDTRTTSSGCRPAFTLRLLDNRFLGRAADATAKYDVTWCTGTVTLGQQITTACGNVDLDVARDTGLTSGKTKLQRCFN